MSSFSLENFYINNQIVDEYDKTIIDSAYNVVDRLEGWKTIKDFGNDENNNFMWTNNKQILNLMTNINNDYSGHSGASLAFTMRIMYNISLLK